MTDGIVLVINNDYDSFKINERIKEVINELNYGDKLNCQTFTDYLNEAFTPYYSRGGPLNLCILTKYEFNLLQKLTYNSYAEYCEYQEIDPPSRNISWMLRDGSDIIYEYLSDPDDDIILDNIIEFIENKGYPYADMPSNSLYSEFWHEFFDLMTDEHKDYGYYNSDDVEEIIDEKIFELKNLSENDTSENDTSENDTSENDTSEILNKQLQTLIKFLSQNDVINAFEKNDVFIPYDVKSIMCHSNFI